MGKRSDRRIGNDVMWTIRVGDPTDSDEPLTQDSYRLERRENGTFAFTESRSNDGGFEEGHVRSLERYFGFDTDNDQLQFFRDTLRGARRFGTDLQ